MLVDEGSIVGVLLLETGHDGRPTKLELATAAGLLTLHPEHDTLHGNVVRPTGIEHVTEPWSDDRLLLVAGTPATAAAATRWLARAIGVGEGHTVQGILVDVALEVRPTVFRVLRPAPDRWRFLPADGGTETCVDVDGEGIPVLGEPLAWPLERDTHR